MDRQAATWQGLQILASASETDYMGEGVSEERNQEPMAQKWDSPHIRAHTCVDVGAGSLLSCGNLQVSRVGGKCLYPPHWFYFKSTMTTQGIGCSLQTDGEALLLKTVSMMPTWSCHPYWLVFRHWKILSKLLLKEKGKH